MQYAITFLEGLISFVSPCFLPMLPLYLVYFAGDAEEGKEGRTLLHALLFVAGFTIVFVLLGMFAGTVGRFLTQYQQALNIICGALVIFFGLSFLDVIRLKFFKGIQGFNRAPGSAMSSLLFGMVFSVSLTPCVGAFLGSALALASNRGSVVEGALLLFLYSMGLGVPLLLSAALISRLKTTFDFIKRHYKMINTIAGIFLILTGILIMFGLMDLLLAILS